MNDNLRFALKALPLKEFAAPLLIILDGGTTSGGGAEFQPLSLRLYSDLTQGGYFPHQIVYAEALLLLVVIVTVYGLARWIDRSHR